MERKKKFHLILSAYLDKILIDSEVDKYFKIDIKFQHILHILALNI